MVFVYACLLVLICIIFNCDSYHYHHVSSLIRHQQQHQQHQQYQYMKKYNHASNIILMAQSGGRGGGGSTKLDKKTIQDTALKPTYKDNIERDYRLILHDDTVHTIQQVCEIVGSVCPLCSGPRAYEVTLEVHMTGAGTICVANKKIVSEFCANLQKAGLTVSMAPDDEFEDGDDLE